jgi:3-methylfumaryl-CoA hydratase
MTEDLERLKEWIGRSEEQEDAVTAAPVAGLIAALDRNDPPPKAGDELPPGWHWMYFLPRARQSQLGPDGHARRGGFLPPVPLPRRMWAGGRLQFVAPLRVGETVRRRSEIADVTVKQGKSGRLVFVLVRHHISAGGAARLTEEHDIVYRDPPDPQAPAPTPQPAPGNAVWRRAIHPDPVLLFRYSALTFNGHRIHYDVDYCRQEEGYPGLVVHGPLTATLLLDLVRRKRPTARLAGFSFRAVSPLFHVNDFTVEGEPTAGDGGAKLWAMNHEGALAMTATAEFAA